MLHHAQGLTAGVRAFADVLRQAGHTVHAPDLYDGRTFPTLAAGQAHADQVGIDEIRRRGVQAAQGLTPDLVYLGFSLGVLPAQQLAQTRAGARGAVLLEACAPVTEFGTAWPAGVPVQIHGMSEDRHFSGEGDLANARDLVTKVMGGELFVYPGNRHLFTDSSLSTYDPEATALVTKRVLEFMAAP